MRENVHLSDHLPVICTLNIELKMSENRKGFFLKWKKEKQDDFEKTLQNKLNELKFDNLNVQCEQEIVNIMSKHLRKSIVSSAQSNGLLVGTLQETQIGLILK